MGKLRGGRAGAMVLFQVKVEGAKVWNPDCIGMLF